MLKHMKDRHEEDSRDRDECDESPEEKTPFIGEECIKWVGRHGRHVAQYRRMVKHIHFVCRAEFWKQEKKRRKEIKGRVKRKLIMQKVKKKRKLIIQKVKKKRGKGKKRKDKNNSYFDGKIKE